MAMCVIAVVGVAPCQCFSPGGNQTTSPGRISSTSPPQRCAQPRPAMTSNACPSGCVCHAVRAPGANVTLAPRTRAGSGASNSGSMRTMPVNQSAGPLVELCEPDLFISIFDLQSSIFYQLVAPHSALQAEMPLLLISVSEFLQVAYGFCVNARQNFYGRSASRPTKQPVIASRLRKDLSRGLLTIYLLT